MKKSNNYIEIALRAYLAPSVHIEEFSLGKVFQIRVAAGTTLNEFIAQIFLHNKQQIGFRVVNGQISLPDIVLTAGDTVEVYPLIAGG